MKTATLAILVIAVSLFYGCASEGMTPTSGSADGAAAPQSIDSLSFKVGDSCTFRYNHNGRKVQGVERVTDISNGLITIAVEGVGVTGTKQMLEERTYSWHVGYNLIHGTPMEANPAYMWVELPIKPGTVWTTSSTVAGTSYKGEPWKVDVTAKWQADRWEKVKVPAGEFLALKVTAREKQVNERGKQFSGTVALWMAPGIGCPIKIELKNSFGDFGSRELLSNATN